VEKRFNLFLTEEMHREIKIKATLENKSMNDLIVEAIQKANGGRATNEQ